MGVVPFSRSAGWFVIRRYNSNSWGVFAAVKGAVTRDTHLGLTLTHSSIWKHHTKYLLTSRLCQNVHTHENVLDKEPHDDFVSMFSIRDNLVIFTTANYLFGRTVTSRLASIQSFYKKNSPKMAHTRPCIIAWLFLHVLAAATLVPGGYQRPNTHTRR